MTGNQQPRRNRTRYATDSVISVRPQAGSAYAIQSRSVAKTDVPGGKKLWCRLVTAFTFTSIIGILLIVLGGIFVSQAHGVHSSSGFSLPLVWCVVSIGEQFKTTSEQECHKNLFCLGSEREG